MFKGRNAKYWNEFKVGEVIETAGRTIESGDVNLFAGLSGDFNPAHINEVHAKKTQFGTRIAHGPLQLDTVARRAFLRNEPLELAAREWAVLEVLLARVEKIVSKEAIIQAVAGWGDELSPNAIEVYVSRLRSKLEPAGIKIRTVRGFGYMLEEFK